MSVLLGIDAGGTKTHARLVGPSGSENFVHPSASWLAKEHGEIVLAARSIRAGLAAEPADICVGASGCETETDVMRMRQAFSEVWPKSRVLVVNDAELVCPAAGLKSGVALVSGTGAIAVATDREGRTWRSGGWGHAIGDDGSAYALTRSAIRAVLTTHDQGRPHGALARGLMQAVGADEPLGLLHAMHASSEPSTWAALAPLIEALADDGDEDAGRLLKGVAGDLTTLAEVVIRRSGVDHCLVLAGGLLRHSRSIRDRVTVELLLRWPKMDVRMLSDPPVAGAVELARRLAATEPANQPSQSAVSHFPPISAAISVSAPSDPGGLRPEQVERA